MTEFPEGYARMHVGGALVIALAEHLDFAASAVADSGSLHGFAAGMHDVIVHAGRGAAYRFEAPGGPWFVRHYHRGGAAARWLGDRYARVGDPRPLAELRASWLARQRGIDTPRVVAAVLYPAGLFYRADLATDYVRDAPDLAAMTFTEAVPADARVAAWAAAGGLIRRAARAGILHADLNLKNILIAGMPVAPRAWMIDLDRCRLMGGASAAGAVRMAARLRRSRAKLERVYRRTADPAQLGAFDHALND